MLPQRTHQEAKIIQVLAWCHGHFLMIPLYSQQNKCDALQQTREQVAQAYFEIWTIEVSVGVKNNSSVDFEIFVFTYLKKCFLSPPYNF